MKVPLSSPSRTCGRNGPAQPSQGRGARAAEKETAGTDRADKAIQGVDHARENAAKVDSVDAVRNVDAPHVPEDLLQQLERVHAHPDVEVPCHLQGAWVVGMHASSLHWRFCSTLFHL